MMFLIMIKGPGYQIELNKGALHQARSSTHPNTTLHGTVVVVYRHVRAPGPCNGQIARNLLCVELQTWKNLRFMACSACFPTQNLPSPNVCARGFSWFFSTFLPHFCHLFPWRFQGFSHVFPTEETSPGIGGLGCGNGLLQTTRNGFRQVAALDLFSQRCEKMGKVPGKVTSEVVEICWF